MKIKIKLKRMNVARLRQIIEILQLYPLQHKVHSASDYDGYHQSRVLSGAITNFGTIQVHGVSRTKIFSSLSLSCYKRESVGMKSVCMQYISKCDWLFCCPSCGLCRRGRRCGLQVLSRFWTHSCRNRGLSVVVAPSRSPTRVVHERPRSLRTLALKLETKLPWQLETETFSFFSFIIHLSYKTSVLTKIII